MKSITPKVSIVSAKRLPIGKIHGIYAQQTPEVLFDSLISQQMSDLTNVSPDMMDEIILGNVTNQGGNLARRCALAAGFGVDKPAYTLDSQCASGLVAIATAAQNIISNQATMIIAGGVESTSSANKIVDRQSNEEYSRFPMVPKGQLDLDMGIVAENLSQAYHISRRQQDEYAERSQKKARYAIENHMLDTEVYPFRTAMLDESPRFDTALEKLSQLKPAFLPNGVVTAGNSCPINDGVASVLLKQYQPDELVQGYYLGHTLIGVQPERFLLGPIAATRQLLENFGLSIADIDVIEMNEAFAVQAILCQEALGIRDSQINPLGGALAYGHPYGATGGILVARLLNSLNRLLKPALGVVTLCVAGGMGMSMLIANKYWTENTKISSKNTFRI